MNSPTTEKDHCVLHMDVREADGCRYEYRLLRREQSPMPYTVEVTFRDDQGCTNKQAAPLPVTQMAGALRLYRMCTQHLVTPIDLPYILENLLV